MNESKWAFPTRPLERSSLVVDERVVFFPTSFLFLRLGRLDLIDFPPFLARPRPIYSSSLAFHHCLCVSPSSEEPVAMAVALREGQPCLLASLGL